MTQSPKKNKKKKEGDNSQTKKIIVTKGVTGTTQDFGFGLLILFDETINGRNFLEIEGENVGKFEEGDRVQFDIEEKVIGNKKTGSEFGEERALNVIKL